MDKLWSSSLDKLLLGISSLAKQQGATGGCNGNEGQGHKAG